MRQKETAVIPIPRRMEITAVLCFQSRHCKLPFAVCICRCRHNRRVLCPVSAEAGFYRRLSYPCWLRAGMVCPWPSAGTRTGYGPSSGGHSVLWRPGQGRAVYPHRRCAVGALRADVWLHAFDEDKTVGYGIGKREFPAANCIRAFWGEADESDLQCGRC